MYEKVAIYIFHRKHLISRKAVNFTVPYYSLHVTAVK